MNNSMQRREAEYRANNEFKDETGACHFPTTALCGTQITRSNPWTLDGKRIPTKSIVQFDRK